MRDPDLEVWVEDDGEYCDCVYCSGQMELTNFEEICDEVEYKDFEDYTKF